MYNGIIPAFVKFNICLLIDLSCDEGSCYLKDSENHGPRGGKKRTKSRKLKKIKKTYKNKSNKKNIFWNVKNFNK